MRVQLVCVGRLKTGPERVLAERYTDRAVAAGRQIGLTVETREIEASIARTADLRKDEEAAAIRAATGSRATLLLFEESGTAMTSAAFAALLGAYRDGGTGTVCLVIGGADGTAPSLKADAARLIAFGAMTWPHQLVRVMACEQLYRAATILIGHPYHRG